MWWFRAGARLRAAAAACGWVHWFAAGDSVGAGCFARLPAVQCLIYAAAVRALAWMATRHALLREVICSAATRLARRELALAAAAWWRPIAWADLREVGSRVPLDQVRDAQATAGLHRPSPAAGLLVLVLRGSPAAP